MTIAPELKNAPYGVDTFPNLLNRNFAYVDKTAFIEQLENCGSDKPFIVRPRRFGKSLFTSMLQAYYDKAAAVDFEKNFAGTYISRHKTPLAGQFYVVKFNLRKNQK